MFIFLEHRDFNTKKTLASAVYFSIKPQNGRNCNLHTRFYTKIYVNFDSKVGTYPAVLALWENLCIKSTQKIKILWKYNKVSGETLIVLI